MVPWVQLARLKTEILAISGPKSYEIGHSNNIESIDSMWTSKACYFERNRYVNAPKNQLNETLLTNKPLQQFIDLVASSSKERGRKAADRPEARVLNDCFTEDQKRATASRLAASAAAAAGAAGRPGKLWSALRPPQQRRRLREGYLHLRQ